MVGTPPFPLRLLAPTYLPEHVCPVGRGYPPFAWSPSPPAHTMMCRCDPCDSYLPLWPCPPTRAVGAPLVCINPSHPFGTGPLACLFCGDPYFLSKSQSLLPSCLAHSLKWPLWPGWFESPKQGNTMGQPTCQPAPLGEGPVPSTRPFPSCIHPPTHPPTSIRIFLKASYVP